VIIWVVSKRRPCVQIELANSGKNRTLLLHGAVCVVALHHFRQGERMYSRNMAGDCEIDNVARYFLSEDLMELCRTSILER
jgi:hypothetical protein